MGMPVAGVYAVWHPRSDTAGVVLAGTFSSFGQCLCFFLEGSQDDEGSEVGWRLFFDIYEDAFARAFPGGAKKGR